MIVDGVQIASDILDEVKTTVATLAKPPVLGLILCAPTFATEKFIAIKKRKASDVGIEVKDYELDSRASTEDALRILKLAIEECDGIVLQLPFPKHIEVRALLGAIPRSHDVDALSSGGELGILSPVVGAIAEIAERYHFSFLNTEVTVVGAGRLVGAPAAEYAKRAGARVTLCTKDDPHLLSAIAEADVLILGAGDPGFVTPALVKEGVVIFDAGTSEDAGKLVGDADPTCGEKASLFTPVPGGIGPITIAVLLRNLVTLISLRD